MSIMQTHHLHGVRQVYANSAAAAADQTLVAAPGANLHIVVDSVVVSSAGVGQFYFETGTTTQIGPRMELVAGNPFVLPNVRIKCAANEALTWTSVGAGIGTHGVFVNYHVEGA